MRLRLKLLAYLLGPAHFMCSHDGVSIEGPESAEDPPVMMGRPCVASDDCESDEVCAPAAGCQKARGWAYGIAFSELFVPLRRPDGTPWDRDGSPPDPDCWMSASRGTEAVRGSAYYRSAQLTMEAAGYRFSWRDPPLDSSVLGQRALAQVSCVDHETVQEEDSGTYFIIHDYCWGDAACEVPVDVLHRGEAVIEQNGAVLKLLFLPSPSRA